MAKQKPKKPSPKHFPSKPYMRAIHAAAASSSSTSSTSPNRDPPTVAWSTSDDELLLTSKTAGKKWVEISPLFPGKTSNACRKRHARLVTNAQLEWNGNREKDLAMEFVAAKVGFFKALAGNLGLEWQQVEKKCVEMGFRTLMEKGKKCSPSTGVTSGCIARALTDTKSKDTDEPDGDADADAAGGSPESEQTPPAAKRKAKRKGRGKGGKNKKRTAEGEEVVDELQDDDEKKVGIAEN